MDTSENNRPESAPMSHPWDGDETLEFYDVRYLDLTGDGVPDAVEWVTRSSHSEKAGTSDAAVSVVNERHHVEYGIDISGTPTATTSQSICRSRINPGRPRRRNRTRVRVRV